VEIREGGGAEEKIAEAEEQFLFSLS